MVKISSFNFVPFLSSIDSRGLLGFINLKLVDETGKDIVKLCSVGVYANRVDNPQKIHLTMPAKKLNTNYNFFFEILDNNLLREIIKLAEEEVEKLGYLFFEKSEEKYENNTTSLR